MNPSSNNGCRKPAPKPLGRMTAQKKHPVALKGRKNKKQRVNLSNPSIGKTERRGIKRMSSRPDGKVQQKKESLKSSERSSGGGPAKASDVAIKIVKEPTADAHEMGEQQQRNTSPSDELHSSQQGSF